MIKLLVAETDDLTTRENMKRIQKELSADQLILKGNWKFYEITFTKAVTNFKFPHLMKFVPQDILQTSIIGVGALTWNYTLFDTTYLNITTTGACVVRAFVGLYTPGGGAL